MSRTLSMVSFCFLAAGCFFGPSVSKVQRDLTPAGVDAVITLLTGSIEGELLGVEDDGLIILSRETLTFVPFTSIRRGRFEWSGAPRIVNGQRPWEPDLEKIRLLSRYPQGVDDHLMSRLLEIYGQDELRISE